EHERRRTRARVRAVRRPRSEQLVAAFALAHLTEIQDERALELVRRAEGGDVVRTGRVETQADCLVRDVLVAEGAMDEVALLGREKPERSRQLEQRTVRRETQRRLV